MTDLARGAMDLRAFSGEAQAAGFSWAWRIFGIVRPRRPRPPTRRRLRREWAAALKLLQAEEGFCFDMTVFLRSSTDAIRTPSHSIAPRRRLPVPYGGP